MFSALIRSPKNSISISILLMLSVLFVFMPVQRCGAAPLPLEYTTYETTVLAEISVQLPEYRGAQLFAPVFHRRKRHHRSEGTSDVQKMVQAYLDAIKLELAPRRPV